MVSSGRSTKGRFSLLAIAGDGGFCKLPEVRLPGLRSVCTVLLSQVVRLVSGQGAQRFGAGFHPCCALCEQIACCDLFHTRRSTSFNRFAHIQAVTVGVRCLCRAMRAKQHLRAGVLTRFRIFVQCTRYTIDTGAPIYMCHNYSNVGATYFCLTANAKRERILLCALKASSSAARCVGSANAVLAACAAVFSAF